MIALLQHAVILYKCAGITVKPKGGYTFCLKGPILYDGSFICQPSSTALMLPHAHFTTGFTESLPVSGWDALLSILCALSAFPKEGKLKLGCAFFLLLFIFIVLSLISRVKIILLWKMLLRTSRNSIEIVSRY